MKPKLRPLEVISTSLRGEEYLLLRDRQGLANDVQVPRAMAPLLALFDGTRDAAALAAAYVARGGESLPVTFVQGLIEHLDEQFLLQSPRLEAYQREIVARFESDPVRPAAFAGPSYPAEPRRLHTLLEGFWQQAAALDVTPKYSPEQLRGIVVPHIDFTRGGVAEALAYRHLARGRFDTLVVLGIAHSGVDYAFCGSAKDYATPLGDSKTDREFVAALQKRVGARFLGEQFAHKHEHSVEFVAVFQQFVPTLKSARMVPILCGGFFEAVRTCHSPLRTFDISQFVTALREVTAEWEAAGRRVGFIASVDLAHVGSRFGDHDPLTPPRLRAIEAADREFLTAVAAGDAEKLHTHIARDNNLRNVDAHPALYTLLAAFPAWRAQLLHYDQAFDLPANSVVSFASMALYDDSKL